jgi:hypothetical protein
MSFRDYKDSPFCTFILPIIPIDAKLSPYSKLDPASLGKIPGYKKGDGWVGFRGWPKSTAKPKTLDAWAQQYIEDGLAETIGLQAQELPACDVDIEDVEAANIVEDLAARCLGPAPKRTRPNSQRYLLQYRIKHGTPRITKRRLAFVRPERPDEIMAVEILGDGQQYLIKGKHPSGVLYEWRDRTGPLQWGHDNLTEIDNDAVNAFLIAVREALLEHGYELARAAGSAPGNGSSPGERYPIGPEHPGRAPSPELVAEFLKHCPCDAPQFASRDGWMKALFAIKAACAGDEAFYDEYVWPWCEVYPENEEEYVRTVWESIHDSSLGWPYLCDLAVEFGWHGWLGFEKIDLEDEGVSPEEPSPGPKRNAPIPKLMPADFALHKLPRRQFVLGNRFMAGVVTLGVGPPGAAKSTLAILTALSIATGEHLTGEGVHRRGRVWIHNNEDSLEELYRRIGGMLKYHDIDFAGVRENVFVTSGLDERLVVAVKEKDIVRRQQAVAEVIASIKQEGIIHIVVDPLVSTHRGVSENSNEEIEQVVDSFRAIAHETGCSIDLIHHSLKPGSKAADALAGDMNAARGASSLIGAVRMVYTVTPMSKKMAEEINRNMADEMKVSDDQAARLVRLDHAKGNYSPRDTRVSWFELESYNIGNATGPDDMFSDGDTIAVPKPWAPPAQAHAPKPGQDREAENRARVQRVRDCVAAAMASDRCRLTEPMLSTDNELVRDIVIAVMASLAKVERQKISDRTKAGLARAKTRGKRLGRVPFGAVNRENLRMVLDAGKTWHAASLATGIPYSTVKKHARAMGYSPPERRLSSVD